MGNIGMNEIVCPGCGLLMPENKAITYDGYYDVSPECWSVYTEVLAAEFSNMVLFGQVHQLTVDTYAVQHAGGFHKAKSVLVHLTGLHLVHEKRIRVSHVSKYLQKLTRKIEKLPVFIPPVDRGELTVLDIAMAGDQIEHSSLVKEWSLQLWQSWSHVHPDIELIVKKHILN